MLCLVGLWARVMAAEPATITFSLDFPNSEPEHYSISVASDGHARFDCSARISADSDDREAYQADFDMTPATRDRIFELAAEVQYFSGKIDSGNTRLAFTGAKKLVYQDSRRTNTASYNYSNLAPVQQLTALFQTMATTLEYGRRLAYYHRYQKLALDEELKRMEAQAKNNELSELQSIHPVLKKIVEDASVMNVVRARAQRLVELAPGGAPNH